MKILKDILIGVGLVALLVTVFVDDHKYQTMVEEYNRRAVQMDSLKTIEKNLLLKVDSLKIVLLKKEAALKSIRGITWKKKI